GVWASLVAGPDIADVDPSAAALRHARRRVGSAPLVELFDQLKGVVAGPDAVGAWWRGLRTVAWDGTAIHVADSAANAAYCGRVVGTNGTGGFPLIRLSALVECGTRALIDAVAGPWKQPEQEQARVLCRALRPGMLLMADRASKGFELTRTTAATGAHLLWRISSDRVPPVLWPLPDGTYLSMATAPNERARLARWARHRRGVPPQVEGVTIRVIEATVLVRARDGRMKTSELRLITTLLDHELYPAGELAVLYHQRWEVETSYFGLKVTLRGSGRVLRSHSVDGVRQELYGLLVIYQAARRIAADTAMDAGIDPDRISLTVTLRTARHTVVNATGAHADPGRPPTPQIRAAILHPRELGPKRRRARILPRRVKRTISNYAYSPTRKDLPMLDIKISIILNPTSPI
ncbi:IS4 family transposase, partial [Streptacidiphilus sp. EB129]|uniref:IS4 family transposase n=1 Tax=Streptacidiphilus sp. EB129 TaxID=3156262 RepID=UPI003517EF29